jgi:putative ABC transport system permease protein
MFDSLLLDLRYAARRLLRTPLFTASAVAVLAIGIGLNAVVFNVVDTALFRPLPFRDAERVVHVYQAADDGTPSSTSFPAYLEMAATTDVFAEVAATSSDNARWDSDGGPRYVSIQYATASYLPVLGLRPYLGRWFDREHDRVGADMVAVVSFAAWRTRFGSDPTVVGRNVQINNQTVTLIGVGPEGFSGDANALVADFWLSISSVRVGGPYRAANLERRGDHWYQVIARLVPGVTVERARDAMRGLAARLAESDPTIDKGRDISVFPLDEVRLHPSLDGALREGSAALAAVAALVLLLACSNLGNLLLARALSRGPEIAVRQVLGSDGYRTARLLLIEALLLSTAGALAGLAMSAWSAAALSSLALPARLPVVGTLNVAFNARVATFGVLLAVATGLLFGLVPALRAASADAATNLRDAGRAHSTGRGVSALRKGLIAAQVAISIVLVIGAGLMARSLANAQRVEPGIDTDRIAVIGTDLPQAGVTQAESVAVVARLLERVAALPGVERAALTSRLPAEIGPSTTQVIDGYRPPAGTGAVELPLAFVSRDYFATMGIPLVAGRTFTPDDRADTPPVIVVNQAAARAYWGGNAVGGRMQRQGAGSQWVSVVGVVADAKVLDLTEDPTPAIYLSTEQVGAQIGAFGFSIVARTSGDPAALTKELELALHDVRPSLPIERELTLKQHLGDGLRFERGGTIALGAFSALALLIASVGIYAVVAFAVGARSHELGIRAALGATAPAVVHMIVRESLVTVSIGLVVGLGLAALLMRGIAGALFGVPPVDAMTFIVSSALLLGAAWLAAWLPARRAASSDPAHLLKSE